MHALLWSFAFLSPQVSRHDDCSKPCDAVTGRTQDARGLIDALLPGCAGTLPRRGLLLLSLTGVNVWGRFATRSYFDMGLHVCTPPCGDGPFEGGYGETNDSGAEKTRRVTVSSRLL